MDAFGGAGMEWPQLTDLGGQEDFVEYHLFSNQALRETDSDKRIAVLQTLQSEYDALVQQWTKDYIWQKEPFELKIYRPGGGETPSQTKGGNATQEQLPHLWGRTRFGDSVDDEWFIVWLLLQLSRHDPNLAISVTDNDGQFLLIEAALVIPRWIKPETTKNRVWIHEGSVHIIPLPRTPAELTQIPSSLDDLAVTLSIVFNPKIKTIADKPVQEAIESKVGEYPAKAHQFHYAKCCVPWQVARILHDRPQLVAPAVEAFFHRDLDDMFLCSKMEKFPPGPLIPPTSATGTDARSASLVPDKTAMVMTMVRFTRCLYAMIASQRFEPPKVFAPFIPQEDHPDYQAYMLGMKLACGFEILYDIKRKTKADEAAAAAVHDVKTYDFEADREWQAFFHTLEGLGYFQGEIKGSREYQRKLGIAKQKYLEDRHQQQDRPKAKGKRETKSSIDKSKRNEEDLSADEARQRALQMEIDSILSRPADGSELLQSLSSSLRPDDKQDWMTVTPEEVDDILARKQREFDTYEATQDSNKKKKAAKTAGPKGSKKKKEKKPSHDDEEDNFDMKEMMNLVGGMKDFMGKISSFEGAEFPDTSSRADSDAMSFDADRFLQIMQQALGGPAGMMRDGEGMDTFDSEDNDGSDEEPDEFFGMGSDEEDDDDEDEEEGDEESATGTDQQKMRRLMREMDLELQKTKLADDFERAPRPEDVLGDTARATTTAATDKEAEAEGEELRPVDINLNLMKNILDSIEAQAGTAGPGTNILKELRDLSFGGRGSQN